MINKNTIVTLLVDEDVYPAKNEAQQCQIDISVLGSKTSIQELMDAHGMSLEYYKRYLPELEAVGIIRLENY